VEVTRAAKIVQVKDIRKEQLRSWIMKKRNLILGIILLTLAIATLIETRKLPIGSLSSPQAGFFPLVLAIILGILSLVFLRQTIRGKDEGKAPPWASGGGLGHLILTVGVLFLYGFSFEPLGYLISTFLLIIFLVGAPGRKKWWVVITVALLSTAVSYLLFDTLLEASLPKGILGSILGS